ncbi:magnetosome-associated protein MamJ-like [Galleria mellonella]|uniref:Magnetosome-associated protein MamJ-like n=1 Tax=Galleria mellonella TaxID=7137 RepID=A0A6J1X224_GALME|nr:magnetosome-associated protein MamJ-like [Galleria mellonella]
MKVFVLALLAVTAFAAPIDQDVAEPVELIVNGVPEGEPLEIGDIVGIKLKEHVNQELVSSTDLLYPLTAEGLAEAAAAEPQPVDPVQIVDEADPVQVVEPEPESVPPPIVLPEPVLPEENPSSIAVHPVLVIPDHILNPIDLDPLPIAPPEPEVVETPVEVLPVPAPQVPDGEIYNDGLVQVTLNAPEESGVLATLQSWLSLAINYFSNGVQTTQQIF